jgi:hypothetical protein
MVKTFCDRCGKEIETKNHVSIYAWITHRTFFAKLRMMSSSPNTDFAYENDDQYICPDCEASYIHWFMHPEEDKTR